MGFYHTSVNVKMIKNMIIDYGSTIEMSPYEYMKNYVEICPETIEDSKLSWIADTFLGILKHDRFLGEVATHLSEELSEEDKDYFVILLHAVAFQIPVKHMNLLYKCLFNLSKPLLDTFTKFLSNSEVFPFLSDVAQADYDTNYINNKIISPLFEWQPYISEMAHSYAEYMKKIGDRKVKPVTVPIQLNVLNRKGKEPYILPAEPLFPVAPANSLRNNTKMLTKSTIDKRLKNIHDRNKQNATNLLNIVKNQNFHYAKTKCKIFSDKGNKSDNNLPKTFPQQKDKVVINSPLAPVKETTATVRRMNNRIQLLQQEEIKWLEDLMYDCKDIAKIEKLEDYDRQEREKERLLDIERNHLAGLISHEEAAIAKKKLQQANKMKYETFLIEREIWNEEIEKWKKFEMEKCRLQYEKLSISELATIEAKNANILKKKENADNVRKESDNIIAKIMKLDQEELERKISIIREIKILSMISNKAKNLKIIDLTETAGFGLLSEMSIAELKEKLSAMKIGLKEELDRKKALIKEDNIIAKRNLEEVKNSIKYYMTERAEMRKVKVFNNAGTANSKADTADSIAGTADSKAGTADTKAGTADTKEISNLRNILEEKRRLRIKLNS